MASATRKEITPAKPAVYDGVTLELTEAEAEVLYDVTHRVGGQPTGPRGRIDSIAVALRIAGIRRPVTRITGGIHYEDA